MENKSVENGKPEPQPPVPNVEVHKVNKEKPPKQQILTKSLKPEISTDEMHEIYLKRMGHLQEEFSKIDVSKLEITPEDLKDPFCNPDKPVKLNFSDISAAAFRIRGGIEYTPCTKSHMSNITGMDIYFKKDFLQYTGSFKDRGARFTLLSLTEEQKQRGVIAASAGNHAQALCYHGRELNIPVVCVMPKIAPIMKVNNCKNYGALVLIEGNDLAESKKVAMRLAKILGLMYINGYDHPNILAGQGTMGLEILEQVPNVDAIIVPTGGAGLLAGVAVAVKTMNPKVMIISAESEKCASFNNALLNGGPKYTKTESTLADGLAVPTVGVNAFASVKDIVDKSVVVREEYIAIAILRLLELEKAVVEGAGACGFAAVLQGLVPELKGKKVVIPLCGGNIDTTILGRVLERGLVADGRMVKVWVTVSDRPGGLAELCRLFASKGASVKDMYHERAWLKDDMFSVQIQTVLEVRDAEHAKEIEIELHKKYDKVIMGSYGINTIN